MEYKNIIDSINDDKIIELMMNLGCERYEEHETFIIFPTICHNENVSEASMKLYYYKNTKMFMCYTECGAQSIFYFLKHYYEARNIEYNWYEDIYNVAVSCTTEGHFETIENYYQSLRDKYQDKKVRKELPQYSENVLKSFQKLYPAEWLNDGITKDAMDKYNIYYSYSQNKIIIPHYDVYNHLVGIRGRALDPWEIENIGKYMPIQIEGKWYSHQLSLNLYGLNNNLENIKKYGICYVGEAEKFCMQCEGFSFPNCSVAVCGSTFNKYHLDLLMRFARPKEIIICFDQEEKNGESKYFNKLWTMCSRYKNYANLSFVYDRQKFLNLKDSPSDNGEEVFKSLIKNRVHII